MRLKLGKYTFLLFNRKTQHFFLNILITKLTFISIRFTVYIQMVDSNYQNSI